MKDIRDGSSNTVMLAETTYDVANGTCAAWAYRAWVQTGCDLRAGINIWASTDPKFGRLASWGQVGSMHPGGCNIAMADGSIRFLPQNTDSVILARMSFIADMQQFELP